MSPVVITKASGEKESFDPTKLENSLLRAGATAEIVDDILETVSRDLKPGTTTKQIYHEAFVLLGKKNRPLAANYSLRRAIMDLGPSGFPFEKLIAEIFNRKGYTTEIGKRIRGACVEHEIDILAYNGNELHLVEAKFHNQLGVKTDTKVALYVKARYDDLAKTEIAIGDQKKVMTKGWLVTNTKFTHNAIHYGKCQNLEFVGWNYPAKGNLHDMILETGLHPLTCLTTLSKSEENVLLDRGLVLLRQLKADPSSLDMLGISKEKKQEVLDEADSVFGQLK